MASKDRIKKLEATLNIGQEDQYKDIMHVVHAAGKAERMTAEEFNMIKDQGEYITVVVNNE
jgi:hypothetical protein